MEASCHIRITSLASMSHVSQMQVCHTYVAASKLAVGKALRSSADATWNSTLFSPAARCFAFSIICTCESVSTNVCVSKSFAIVVVGSPGPAPMSITLEPFGVFSLMSAASRTHAGLLTSKIFAYTYDREIECLLNDNHQKGKMMTMKQIVIFIWCITEERNLQAVIGPKDLGVNLLLGPCAQNHVEKHDKQRPLMHYRQRIGTEASVQKGAMKVQFWQFPLVSRAAQCWTNRTVRVVKCISLRWIKIYVLSNLSNCKFTTGQY